MSFVFLLTGPGSATAAESRSLAGQWRFELDRQNTGIEEKWFARELSGKLKLPGSLPAQGIGDDVSVATKWMGDIVDKSWFTAPQYAPYRQPGNIKVPFWLQPAKYYAGVAWYQRDIAVPDEWQGKRVVLTLERPHWETQVWLDGRPLGSNNSLSTPHQYNLGTGLAPGKHRLTVRVDNGLVVDVGVNSHSITDHTQGNWNGMVGEISLQAGAPVWLDDLQVYPHLATKSLSVKGRLGNATGQAGRGTLVLALSQLQGAKARNPSGPITNAVAWETSGGAFEAEIPLASSCQFWDEFHPALYRLTARLEEPESEVSATVGLREISTEGTQFVLNGRKMFIRGTLECCIFPKTGHPPTEVAEWRRIIRVAKAHGLNLLRFHSWCPPEAAFAAADELGFYYQVEIASWANQSTTLGDGKPVDQWLYQEAERILRAYGNHPSFLLMPYGNEPGGKRHKEYLAQWVTHWKATDPRRLYTSGSGWPELAENQFHVTPDPRIQRWGEGLRSRINALPPETLTDYRDFIRKRSVPVISHEIGQWCVYPNFDEIPKYTGYLKPKNFEIFRDSLAAHHLSDLAHRFLLASGKLQTLCYKEDIESALRTPGMGGFELLDLHDFPGQGTALVGVLDPFWESKGYVTPQEYSRFCNSTVPLARLGKRVFTADEKLAAQLEVAHFGPAPLAAAVPQWRLVGDDHQVVAHGEFPPRDIPIGNGIALGQVAIDLANLKVPARYKLVVSIGQSRAGVSPAPGPERGHSCPPDRSQGQERTGMSTLRAGGGRDTCPAVENDWDVWVYPARVDIEPPPGVLLATELNDAARSALLAGGKVLLTVPANQVKGDAHGRVALGFSSIFWNTAWTHGQPPHTLGILCEPKHPALAGFPTDYHSNWQWWYLISRAGAMVLDDLPRDLRPTVEVIDDWVTNRKLGLVFEARVGPGSLLVCSVDLKHEAEGNPVARQLLRSLLDYLSGAKFKPAVRLTPEQVQSLLAEPSPMQKHGARMGHES